MQAIFFVTPLKFLQQPKNLRWGSTLFAQLVLTVLPCLLVESKAVDATHDRTEAIGPSTFEGRGHPRHNDDRESVGDHGECFWSHVASKLIPRAVFQKVGLHHSVFIHTRVPCAVGPRISGLLYMPRGEALQITARPIVELFILRCP